jgi:nucleoside-diphosphate-sugar epimerase
MDNLIALVTGANKGIGKEIARLLAAAGLTVYVGSRDAARGQRAVDEIGGDSRPLVLDVTDAATIQGAASHIDILDILINNVGISSDATTADREDVATFRRVYQTNVFGVVAVTNAFVPALRRSAHPRIVSTRTRRACATPTSTPGRPPATATPPRARRARSGWRCCQTTARRGSASTGTGPRFPGEAGAAYMNGQCSGQVTVRTKILARCFGGAQPCDDGLDLRPRLRLAPSRRSPRC